MRDGFVFYRSFYESAKALNETDRLALYEAIFELGLNQTETKQEPLVNAFMNLIKPQLEANNRRYENGKKGGRPATEKPNHNQTITKDKPKEKEKEKEKEKVKEEEKEKYTHPPLDNNTNINNYDDFITILKEKSLLKSKVTKSKDGRKIFNQIKDKSLLMDDYVKYQEDKKEYAIRITAFMEDYSAYKNYIPNSNSKPQQYQTKQEKTDEAIRKFVDERFDNLAVQDTQIKYLNENEEEPF